MQAGRSHSIENVGTHY